MRQYVRDRLMRAIERLLLADDLCRVVVRQGVGGENHRLELISEALGHSSIETTMIYAHISTTKQRADIARYLEGGA
jgi:integrase